MRSVLALLYDIHGNLPALEAVLADAKDADEYLLGGDYATFGPWPVETVERLRRLPSATWIRGNVDRWLVDSSDTPEPMVALVERSREMIEDDLCRELASLPESTTRDGTLFCHGSPLSDMNGFYPGPQKSDVERLAGTDARRVVFGHTHIEFERRGPGGVQLVNPGSVGMPWDGDHRAAYAVLDGGAIEFRRVEYDWRAAAQAVRERVGELPARRMELARFHVD